MTSSKRIYILRCEENGTFRRIPPTKQQTHDNYNSWGTELVDMDLVLCQPPFLRDRTGFDVHDLPIKQPVVGVKRRGDPNSLLQGTVQMYLSFNIPGQVL